MRCDMPESAVLQGVGARLKPWLTGPVLTAVLAVETYFAYARYYGAFGVDLSELGLNRFDLAYRSIQLLIVANSMLLALWFIWSRIHARGLAILLWFLAVPGISGFVWGATVQGIDDAARQVRTGLELAEIRKFGIPLMRTDSYYVQDLKVANPGLQSQLDIRKAANKPLTYIYLQGKSDSRVVLYDYAKRVYFVVDDVVYLCTGSGHSIGACPE
jgi:hypothetical protein